LYKVIILKFIFNQNFAGNKRNIYKTNVPSRVSNKDMLNEVFNFYLRNHTSQENVYEPGDYIPFADTSFTKCDENYLLDIFFFQERFGY
jgi:hypothetical protein